MFGQLLEARLLIYVHGLQKLPVCFEAQESREAPISSTERGLMRAAALLYVNSMVERLTSSEPAPSDRLFWKGDSSLFGGGSGRGAEAVQRPRPLPVDQRSALSFACRAASWRAAVAAASVAGLCCKL